jgi:hypothetical protein
MYTIRFTTRKRCDKYPFGLFRAQLVRGGKVFRSKDGSLGVLSPRDAYQLLQDTAAEWSTTNTVTTLNTPSFKEMCDAVNGKEDEGSTFSSLFGHGGKYKAGIRAAYRDHGYTKVMGMLSEGGVILDEIHAPVIKKEQALGAANIAVAWALYKVTLSTGVRMEEQCKTDNIKRLYKGHFEQDGTIKKYYVLEGERWDGKGNPPTSFKKWINHTKADNYDELIFSGYCYG